jgi:hypothetical protein
MDKCLRAIADVTSLLIALTAALKALNDLFRLLQ